MKRVEVHKYGAVDSVQIAEAAVPVPGNDEVLVKVKAASINFNTLIFVTGKPWAGRMFTGLFKPNKIPGNDYAGVVEAVGENVTGCKVGDEVFGDSETFGTLAEYVCVSKKDVTLKPKNLSFEESAAVPEAGLVAYQGLKDAGQIQPGRQVLIAGASGGIGTFAVQFAKHFGAEVWATCSTKNIELVKSLGADHVIDYTKDDFLDCGIQFDLILATAGFRPLSHYKGALKPQGRYVSTGGKMKQVFQAILFGGPLSQKDGKQLMAFNVIPNKDLAAVRVLLEAGEIKPIIDKSYPFDNVREALAHYHSGKARGKIVVSM